MSAIITTQFQRTRQTAAPSAEALGVVPDVAEVKGGVPDHVKAIADLVRGRFAGRTVLIVGHSNTVPAIVNALGGRKLPDLCDDSYDDLFTVVLSADGAGRLIHSRYGAPSTATAACPAIMK